jgi:transposase
MLTQDTVSSVLTVVHGVAKRWVFMKSQQAWHRETETFDRNLDRTTGSLIKSLWHLSHHVFQCSDDAQQALKPIIKSLRYRDIHYKIVPLLKQYKEQPSVESSFKFIKNGAFELDSFLLKTPARMCYQLNCNTSTGGTICT